VNLGVVNPNGEGLYASSVELEIRASSITGNTGANPASAGVHLHGVTDALIVNSTIAGNSANGLRIYNSSAEISQCTIVDNGNRGLSFGSSDGFETGDESGWS
jgi:sulfopyruvate decarboxylase TPP-binding subunit